MKKKIIVLLVALFAFIPFVNAKIIIIPEEAINKIVSFDSTEMKTYESTTEGVDIQVDKKYDWGCLVSANILYTITKDYNPSLNNGKIVFNISQDVFGPGEIVVSPGDEIKVAMTIKNDTNYKFEYSDESLIISSYSYKEKNDENAKTVETFDGNEVDKTSIYTIDRTANAALKQLFKKAKTTVDYTDTGVELALSKILDENGNKKYPNGILDLDKYYLDYYGKINGETYSSLLELRACDLVDIFKGNHLYADDDKTIEIHETNSNLAKIGYDLLYNKILTVLPETFEGEKVDVPSEYSVGNYMRNEAPQTLNDQIKKYVEDNNADETTKFSVKINGRYMANAYQGYKFGLNVSIKLSTPSYKVYTNYIDVDGKVISDQEVEFNKFSGEDYTTLQKKIEGYELVRIDGEKSGVIQDKDVVVTYVYEFVMGEGGEEFDVVQTGSEIDYSLMSSAAITLSLVALAIISKRKKNN